MSEINDEFMEAFKHLDKICREMFHAERGITTYINEMERIPNGSGVVSNWNSTLRRLKELRHIRNQYSHEIGTSYTELCTWEDVDWLNVFYEDILNTRDPLAQYRSAMAFRARRTNTTKQVASPTKRQVTPRPVEKGTEPKESAQKYTDIILVVFSIIFIVIVIGIMLFHL